MPPSSSYFPLCPISCCSKSPKKKLAQNEEISIRINNKETLAVPARSAQTPPKVSKKVVYSRSIATSSNVGSSPPNATAIDIEMEDEFSTARTHGSDRKHLSMKDLLHNVRVEEGLSARSAHGEMAVDKRCSLPTIPELSQSQSASDLPTNTPHDANNIDVEAIDTQPEQKKKRKAAVFNQHGDISARTVDSSNSQLGSSRSDGMFDELPSFQVSSPAQASSAVQRYIIYPPQVVMVMVSVAYTWFVSFIHLFTPKTDSE
ncbi:unnamed protein product [Auanema sp. JU1783]|nr:unnamed protein product [Auanema sp. JU1783]